MSERREQEDLSVGYAPIDGEHTAQLALLDELAESVRCGADDAVIYAKLQQLVEHTNLHFLSEQLLMRLHVYEGYQDHLIEHDRLMLEARNIQESLDKGNVTETHGLIEALRNWLLVHMQTTDAALGRYLSQQKVEEFSQEGQRL